MLVLDLQLSVASSSVKSDIVCVLHDLSLVPVHTDVLPSPLRTEVTPGYCLPFQTVAMVADNAAVMRYNTSAS